MELDITEGGVRPISSLSPGILRKHKANIFIETGTGYCNGILTALAVGFYKEIHSTEWFSDFYNFACDYFWQNPIVHLYKGDSREQLQKILNGVNERAVIWLDAHTLHERNPLFDELEMIACHPIKNHCIMIDDRRVWGMDYVCWKDITEKKIIEKLSKYNISYEDSLNGPKDILVADLL